MGQQERRLGISQHKSQAIFGVGRVQGNVGSAGLEDTEQSHHHLRRAFNTEADQRLRPDAQLLQVVGQLIGPPVQFAVGQLSRYSGCLFWTGREGNNGDSLWRQPGLSFKELMNADHTSIKFVEQFVKLAGAGLGQFGHPIVGLTQPLAEHVDEFQRQVGVLPGQGNQRLAP